MKIFQFTVDGRGAFPLDMLRYDACWPETSVDVMAMELESRIKREVKLMSNHKPTAARWLSFGWPVVKESVR